MKSLKVKLQLATLLLANVALYVRGTIPRENKIFAIQGSIDTELPERTATKSVLHEIDCPKSWLQLGLSRWDSAANLGPTSDEVACEGSNLLTPQAMNYNGEFYQSERHVTHGFSPPSSSDSAWVSNFEEQASTSQACSPKFKKRKNTEVRLEDSKNLSKQLQGNPGTLCMSVREKSLSKGCLKPLTRQLQQAETEPPALENYSKKLFNQESSLTKQIEKISAKNIELALLSNDESHGESEALMTDPEFGNDAPIHAFPGTNEFDQGVKKKNRHHMFLSDKNFTVILKPIHFKDWKFIRLDLKKNEDEKKIDAEFFLNFFQKTKGENWESLSLWKNGKLGNRGVCEFENGPYPKELKPKFLRMESLAEIVLGIFDQNFKGSEYLMVLEGIRELAKNSLQKKIRGYERNFCIAKKIFKITEFVINLTKMVPIYIRFILKLVEDKNSKYSEQKEMEGVLIFLEEFWKEIYQIKENTTVIGNDNLKNIREIATFGDSFQTNYKNRYKFKVNSKSAVFIEAWTLVQFWLDRKSKRIFGNSTDFFISTNNLAKFSNRLIVYSNYSLILKGIQKNKIFSSK